MTAPLHAPVELPAWAWQRPDVRKALAARDVAAVLRFAQQYAGASQARLAVACGIGQGRLNEVINGRREITRLDVFERLADGLGMPDDARMLLGLAPRRVESADAASQAGRAEIARVFASQSTAASDIRDAVRAASVVDLLAVRALGLIGLNDSLLREPLTADPSKPVTVRVLLLDPDAETAARRATEIGESPESFSAGIRLAIARLRDLADEPGVTLAAATYTTLPTWRTIRVDGTVYLSAFADAAEGHHSAVYKLAAAPVSVLHAGFLRAFDDQWVTAERVV
ncbi:MAG TPA: helix-turn-helix transcriptional regulator [Streptosporangiales bacterium]